MQKPSKTTRSAAKQNQVIRRRYGMYFFVIVAAVMALTLTAAVYAKPIAKALTLATTHQPEGYTELSFVTSSSNPLPSSAPVDTPRQFSFQITNHQTQSVSYHYIVTLSIGSVTTTVASGAVAIADGNSESISPSFTMPVASSTGIIDVHLTTTNQHIYFRSYS